ncbi:MAG TPA: hypothetical protein PLA94_32605, partial [Myxococcota bacterium]|nr:hypothetical protein [Myxococcota bacterium]
MWLIGIVQKSIQRALLDPQPLQQKIVEWINRIFPDPNTLNIDPHSPPPLVPPIQVVRRFSSSDLALVAAPAPFGV